MVEKLDFIAGICAILAILNFIVEYPIISFVLPILVVIIAITIAVIDGKKCQYKAIKKKVPRSYLFIDEESNTIFDITTSYNNVEKDYTDSELLNIVTCEAKKHYAMAKFMCSTKNCYGLPHPQKSFTINL